MFLYKFSNFSQLQVKLQKYSWKSHMRALFSCFILEASELL